MLLRLRALSFRFALVSVAVASGAVAAGQIPDEPDRDDYLGRPVARTMHWRGADWLLRETREKEEATSILLEKLGVRPGQTVCDLGCGNGYLALPIARAVGDAGRVLAVDIQPPMLVMLEERAQAAGLENIETITAGLANPNIPKGSCDLVIMLDVYHEISRPESVLHHVRAGLKDGGRVCFVEFRAEDPKVPIKREHKMSKAQLMLEMAHNGFKFAAEFDKLPWQHVVFFEKDERGSDLVSGEDVAMYEDVLGFQAVAEGFMRSLCAGDTRSLRGYYATAVDVRSGSEILKETRGGAPGDRETGAAVPGVVVCERLAGLIEDVERAKWREIWSGLPDSGVRAEPGPAVEPTGADGQKHVDQGTLTVALDSAEFVFEFARNGHGQWHVVAEQSDY